LILNAWDLPALRPAATWRPWRPVTPEEAKPNADSPALRYDTRVKAAGIFFPPTDFLDWDGKLADMKLLGELLFLGGTNGHSDAEIKERALQISPARLVKPPVIPFLLIHGDADPLVPLQQSQKMVAALKAAGGSPELICEERRRASLDDPAGGSEDYGGLV